MKLETNLTNRAGMMYIAPLLDVVLLLLVFFLLGSSLILKSGYAVSVPYSQSSLPSTDRSHVITMALAAGGESTIYFNEHRVGLDELDERLKNGDVQIRQIILRADRGAPFGEVVKVSNLVLSHGYDLMYATTPDHES
jgi:biopolymer transport protein ExbD